VHKSYDKLSDFLVNRMATPFPAQGRGLFSNTEFVPVVHRSVPLTCLFLIVQPLLQLTLAMSPSKACALHLLRVMLQ
jgi:hypothetical protein